MIEHEETFEGKKHWNDHLICQDRVRGLNERSEGLKQPSVCVTRRVMNHRAEILSPLSYSIILPAEITLNYEHNAGGSHATPHTHARTHAHTRARTHIHTTHTNTHTARADTHTHTHARTHTHSRAGWDVTGCLLMAQILSSHCFTAVYLTSLSSCGTWERLVIAASCRRNE